MTFDTPEDSGLPVDLTWFDATTEIRPTADKKNRVSSTFLCAECNNEVMLFMQIWETFQIIKLVIKITFSLFFYEDDKISVPINNTEKERLNPQKFAKKLQDEFHTYHSIYYGAFFSQSVTFDTPEDSALHVDLTWFDAPTEIMPTADKKNRVSSTHLCEECNNEVMLFMRI